jgi:hypothetical protein
MVTFMEKRKKGAVLLSLGVLIFLASIALILPIPELYLAALVLMFVGIVLIGIGGALMKGFDRSLDSEKDECYYCKGNGRVREAGEEIVCPRCGGTGVAPDDDS